MQVAPREKFGIGSKLKKFVRKIIPNEIADIAVKAAPFVAPFNPLLAAGMSGIGSFDQTGKIGDSLKKGALTYGMGQGARYLGGADFQGLQNPFSKGAFSMPTGSGGIKNLFKSDVKPVQAIDSGSIDMVTGGADGVGIIKDSVVTTPGSAMDSFNVIKSLETSAGEKSKAALDLLKRGSKALFYTDGKLDKNAVLGAVTAAASYAEALYLASQAGMDLTEQEYDEAKRAEKKEQYGDYLQDFFGNKRDGGRIGFESGANEMIKTQLLEEIMPRTDTTTEDYVMIMTEDGPKMVLRSELPSESMMMDTTTSAYGDAGRGRPVPEFANGGRIGLKFGTKPEEAEVGIMTIDVEAGDDDDMEDMDMAGITFSRPEKSYLFRRLGGSGGADRSYTMPNLYKILSNPNKYPEDAAILKEIAIMGLGESRADGGRIGFNQGSSPSILDVIKSFPGALKQLFSGETSAFLGGDQAGMNEATVLKGYGIDLPKETIELIVEMYKKGSDSETISSISGADTDTVTGIIDMLNMNIEQKAKGGRIGYAKGANRVSELLILRDEKIGKDEDVSDIEAEIFQLTGKTFKSVGGISDIPTGKMRKNNAGVVERDYRDEGGFVPVGIKERADDVPAMLSKNEFVMTADAVRGIGNGSVEEGSKKLYNTMKKAEQVGKA